jgi:hypothetical protein
MHFSDSERLYGPAGVELLTVLYGYLDELQAAFPDSGR